MTECQGQRLDSSWSRGFSFCRINAGHNIEAQSLNSLAGEVAALMASQGQTHKHTHTLSLSHSHTYRFTSIDIRQFIRKI